MSVERGNPLLRFLKEARRRHVHTTAAGYIAVTLVLIQIGDALFSAVGLPNANKTLTLVLFVLFPFVLGLAWMFDVRGRIVKSEWFDDGTPAPKTSAIRRVFGGSSVNRAAPPVEKPRAPMPALQTGVAPAAERVQRATIAHIRHELKTPINAIIGYSEMLLEDAPAGPAAADLQRIRSAGRMLLSAVEDILNPDHHQSNLRDYGERIRTDLRDPITAVIGYCEMLLEGDDPDTSADDLHRIRTSALRLLELSTDIVQISTESPAGERYDEVSALTETVLAKLSPLNVAAAEERQGVLLVVDDNPLNRDLLSRQLARKGYEVATADSGAAALQQLDESTFDLVLLDIIMPGMDGVEVLRRIRAQPRLEDVGVIMTSSLDEIDSVVRCLENGAADYVTKPFDPTLLDARIGACLKLRRLRQREEFYRQQLEAHAEAAQFVSISALPTVVANRIDTPDAHVIDETDQATVLWCDLERVLRGAGTSTSAQASRMRAAFDIIQSAAARNGVEVIALLGGGVLLAAGIPTPCDDHPMRIAATATSALSGLRALFGTDTSPLRFGIHTGAAAATILGSQHPVYHVWGDAIDIARKLEARADAGTIHISTATHALLTDFADFNSRGVSDIGGRQMRTYTLTDRVVVPAL